MIIDLDEKQKKLLLETLGKAHMVEFLKGNDNQELASLIEKVRESLKKEGNLHIFDSVFSEYKS